MTWFRVWLPEGNANNIQAQRQAVYRLLDGRVLSYELEERLSEIVHVLAAVEDARREGNK